MIILCWSLTLKHFLLLMCEKKEPTGWRIEENKDAAHSFSKYSVFVITGHRMHMVSAVMLLTVTWG